METEVKKWGWKCFVLGHEAEGKVCVDCTKADNPGFKTKREISKFERVTLKHFKTAQRRREQG